MVSLFFSVLASLFAVVNPLGAVPVFLALTGEYESAERTRVARSSSMYFVAILLTFFLAGNVILSFFGISLNALRIAGGLIILHSGYGLLKGQSAGSRSINKAVKDEAHAKDDISFTPLAMPLLSGPGSISLLIGLFAENNDWIRRGVIVFTIFAMGLVVFLIFRSAPYLFRVLGVSGLKALSRIMGFLVMSIGIQYIIAGLVNLVQSFLAQQ
ncbi:MAG: stress protection protein MarC [Bacteroidetes bacterium]|nr:MAG: stress protection protein MarC [Bacteroidota bacterium]PTM14930.1 MAG: stress protection protein MarC [Bacteroidota bacterium]